LVELILDGFTKESSYKDALFFIEIGLLKILTMAKKKGLVIETSIIGVEPKIFHWGTELTEELKSMIPVVIDMILKDCKRHKLVRFVDAFVSMPAWQ
jgi:Ni,Fe-hydrogenase maturation factor